MFARLLDIARAFVDNVKQRSNAMTKKTKPAAAKPQKEPPLKYRRWTPEELRDIVELVQALRPKERRLKVETVPFGMD